MSVDFRNIEPPSDAIVELVDAFIVGVASDDQIAELNRAIESDADVAAYVTAALDMHATLAWTRRGPGATDWSPAIEPTPTLATAPRWRPMLAIAASLLLAAAAVAIYQFAFAAPDPGAGVGPTRARVATLINATGTVVIDDAVATAGRDYPAGAITVDRGIAEFLLNNGTRVELRGQTELVVVSGLRSRLMRGVASFVCPKQAKGYTVSLTGGINVIDLGTAFGVRVDDDGVGREVWVTQGRVKLEGVMQPIELIAGDAVRIGADLAAVAIAIDPVRHLGVDASLVGLWRFEDPTTIGRPSWVGSMLNASGDAHIADDPERGRVLVLDGDGDLLEANELIDHLPTGASAYTVAAWFRADDGGNRGIIGWGQYEQGGRVNALRLDEAGGYKHYWWGNDLEARAAVLREINQPLTHGRWTHIAATWDGSVRRLYVNGRPVSEDKPIAPNVAHEQFAIGRTAPNQNEYFNGALDDVAIFDRALSRSEIVEIMNGEFGTETNDGSADENTKEAGQPAGH